MIHEPDFWGLLPTSFFDEWLCVGGPGQVQGRVDQFFASSSGRRVVSHHQGATGSSNYVYQAEEESNVHWRIRPSSSASPSPGVDGAADFERKRFIGKAQDEDLSLSMFRKVGQLPGNQVIGRPFCRLHSPPLVLDMILFCAYGLYTLGSYLVL